MNPIHEIIEYIISKTVELNKIYLPNELTTINYLAIFCQNAEEYEHFNVEANRVGNIIEQTPTGPVYKFDEPFQTIVGPLLIFKIRKPFSTHLQRGDADFTLKDYNSFKEKNLKDTEHFKCIDRENFEMIQLCDSNFDVLSYFSNIPLIQQFGIR